MRGAFGQESKRRLLIGVACLAWIGTWALCNAESEIEKRVQGIDGRTAIGDHRDDQKFVIGHTRLLMEEKERKASVRAKFRKEVNDYIDSGADLNKEVEETGGTLLIHAAYGGYLSLVTRLVANGADINGKSKVNGFTPLIAAARGGHLSITRQLITEGADLNSETKQGMSALWWASYLGYDKIAGELIKARADVNCVNKNGTSCLYIATQEGHKQIVDKLLRNKANPNTTTAKGQAPLLAAVQYNARNKVVHEDLVEMLLRAGADPNSSKPNLQSALWVATFMKDEAVVEMLLEKGADTSVPAKDGTTPVYVSVMRDCMDCLEHLLDHGAKVDPVMPYDKWTPLHVAAGLGNKKAVALLLQHGAKKDQRDFLARTPLDVIGRLADVSKNRASSLVKLLSADDTGIVSLISLETIGDGPSKTKEATRKVEGSGATEGQGSNVSSYEGVQAWAVTPAPEDEQNATANQEILKDRGVTTMSASLHWFVAFVAVVIVLVCLQAACMYAYYKRLRTSTGENKELRPMMISTPSDRTSPASELMDQEYEQQPHAVQMPNLPPSEAVTPHVIEGNRSRVSFHSTPETHTTSIHARGVQAQDVLIPDVHAPEVQAPSAFPFVINPMATFHSPSLSKDSILSSGSYNFECHPPVKLPIISPARSTLSAVRYTPGRSDMEGRSGPECVISVASRHDGPRIIPTYTAADAEARGIENVPPEREMPYIASSHIVMPVFSNPAYCPSLGGASRASSAVTDSPSRPMIPFPRPPPPTTEIQPAN